MSKLIVMVGLQASGKSTIAKKIAQNIEEIYQEFVNIVSSDTIRKQYPELDTNEKVFNKYYADINYWLEKGHWVIADATNISRKSRKGYFTRVGKQYEKVAHIVNTPYEECVRRLEERNKDENSHKVPLEALERYWKSFEIPFKEEGWYDIYLDTYSPEIDYKGMRSYEAISQMKDFDQDNPHHKHTLGEHSKKVYDTLNEKFYEELPNGLWDREKTNMLEGSKLHDVGKLWTKVPNKKDANISSYYGHANVGAYWKICNGFTIEEAFYENYHMHPYNWNTDKAKNKWKKIFGERKFNNLLTLNEADRLAH